MLRYASQFSYHESSCETEEHASIDRRCCSVPSFIVFVDSEQVASTETCIVGWYSQLPYSCVSNSFSYASYFLFAFPFTCNVIIMIVIIIFIHLYPMAQYILFQRLFRVVYLRLQIEWSTSSYIVPFEECLESLIDLLQIIHILFLDIEYGPCLIDVHRSSPCTLLLLLCCIRILFGCTCTLLLGVTECLTKVTVHKVTGDTDYVTKGRHCKWKWLERRLMIMMVPYCICVVPYCTVSCRVVSCRIVSYDVNSIVSMLSAVYVVCIYTAYKSLYYYSMLFEYMSMNHLVIQWLRCIAYQCRIVYVDTVHSYSTVLYCTVLLSSWNESSAM